MVLRLVVPLDPPAGAADRGPYADGRHAGHPMARGSR